MLLVTLNVGLLPSAKLPPSGMTSDQRMLQAVSWSTKHLAGPIYLEQRLHGVPEPTLVVQGYYPAHQHVPLHEQVAALAVACEQDCIAYHCSGPGCIYPGQLAGPRAVDWEPFDPQSFIQPARSLP